MLEKCPLKQTFRYDRKLVSKVLDRKGNLFVRLTQRKGVGRNKFY